MCGFHINLLYRKFTRHKVLEGYIMSPTLIGLTREKRIFAGHNYFDFGGGNVGIQPQIIDMPDKADKHRLVPKLVWTPISPRSSQPVRFHQMFQPIQRRVQDELLIDRTRLSDFRIQRDGAIAGTGTGTIAGLPCEIEHVDGERLIAFRYVSRASKILEVERFIVLGDDGNADEGHGLFCSCWYDVHHSPSFRSFHKKYYVVNDQRGGAAGPRGGGERNRGGITANGSPLF